MPCGSGTTCWKPPSGGRELAQRGALFPWRTISGDEASPYYAAGTAQYHIDADISYALFKYVAATGDDDVHEPGGHRHPGRDRRMWADLGFWQDKGSGWQASTSTVSPDWTSTRPWSTTTFTNVMARFNLRKAAEVLRGIGTPRWRGLPAAGATAQDLARGSSGVGQGRRGNVHPVRRGLGINPQDSHFLDREVWDLKNTPPERFPLLLNYHPLVIYRFQVLKQADVVLALFLKVITSASSRSERTSTTTIPSPLGTPRCPAWCSHRGGGRLPRPGPALLPQRLVRRLGRPARKHHGRGARGLDRRSLERPGLRLRRDAGPQRGDHFDPRLPDSWTRLTFQITLRGTRVRVNLTWDEICFEVVVGDTAEMFVREQRVVVTAGAPCRVPLDDHGPRIDHVPRLQTGDRRPDGTLITASVPGSSRPRLAGLRAAAERSGIVIYSCVSTPSSFRGARVWFRDRRRSG